jgi:FkbM family methyltransferase
MVSASQRWRLVAIVLLLAAISFYAQLDFVGGLRRRTVASSHVFAPTELALQLDCATINDAVVVDASDTGGVVATTTKLGHKMYVAAGEDIVSRFIRERGEWHPKLTAGILKLMSAAPPTSDALFVDVGANIGWFTTAVAAAGHRVVAFEPFTENVALLQRSLCAAGDAAAARVRVIKLGLAERVRRCNVLVHSINRHNGMTQCYDDDSPAAAAAATTAPPPRGHEIVDTMRMQRLDDVIREAVWVLKVDVEGFEPAVFSGADALFADGFPPAYIVCELNVPQLTSRWPRERIVDFVQSFLRRGYDAYLVGGRCLKANSRLKLPHRFTRGNVGNTLVGDSNLHPRAICELYMRHVATTTGFHGLLDAVDVNA